MKFIKKIFNREFIAAVKKYALAHKVVSAIVIIIIVFAGYKAYGAIASKSGAIEYVTAIARQGSIIVSVTGSGQVSASNQVDIKAKASGDVIYVGAKVGDQVKKGALLAQLDSADARKSIRDAEANLESAQIALDKFKLQNSPENLSADLNKAYDDGFNTVADIFLDLPSIMSNLQNMLYTGDSSLGGAGIWNIDYYASTAEQYDSIARQYRLEVQDKYNTAKAAYDGDFTLYKNTSRFADQSSIEALINNTYDTVKKVADFIKSANDLIQFYQTQLAERNLKPAALSNTHLADLNSDTGKTNGYLVNLLSTQQSIQNSQDAIVSSGLDSQSQELSLRQKENTLADAKEKLSDYYVVAPFAGTIAKMDIKKGDSLSSGGVAATLVTDQEIAELSLNEIDAAKIKAGQEAALTFDAVPDLTIIGEVAEVDAVGTVTQGVVTYAVQIDFNSQDGRIKPGMSVNATIITETKDNILVVPSSAIKFENNAYYVEVVPVSGNSVPQNEFGSSTDLATLQRRFADRASSTLTASGSQPFGSSTGRMRSSSSRTFGANGTIGNTATPAAGVAPQRRPVRVGITNDVDTEIISGLESGEVVVIRTISGVSAAPATTAPTAQSLLGGGAARNGTVRFTR